MLTYIASDSSSEGYWENYFAYSVSYSVHYIAHVSKSQIKQKEVDFHQYYKNGRDEELKYRMGQKCYPPCCKIEVQA